LTDRPHFLPALGQQSCKGKQESPVWVQDALHDLAHSALELDDEAEIAAASDQWRGSSPCRLRWGPIGGVAAIKFIGLERPIPAGCRVSEAGLKCDWQPQGEVWRQGAIRLAATADGRFVFLTGRCFF